MESAGDTIVKLVESLIGTEASPLSKYLGYVLSNVFLVVSSHDSEPRNECLRKLISAIHAYQVTQDPPNILCDMPTCGTCYPYKQAKS